MLLLHFVTFINISAGAKRSGPDHLLHKPPHLQRNPVLCKSLFDAQTSNMLLWHRHCFLLHQCDGQCLLPNVPCCWKVTVFITVFLCTCIYLAAYSVIFREIVCFLLQIFPHRLPTAGLHQTNKAFSAGLCSGLGLLHYHCSSCHSLWAVYNPPYFCSAPCSSVHRLLSWNHQSPACCHLSAHRGKTENCRNSCSVAV